MEFQTIKKATPYQKVHVWSCKRRSGNICKGVVVVNVTMFINRSLREGNVGEDYIHVAQDNDQRQTCERGNEHPLSIKGEGLLEQLNGY